MFRARALSSRRPPLLISLLLLLGCAAPAPGATRYDPKLRFRTFRTAHFDIHAHQGEEAMAARLASIVERVRLKFDPVFGAARGRVQVILVDQTDLSNGWATPFPYDTIEITAVPPSAESFIGNTTDWLELVFTHEYTHILHLDRSRGLMQAVRRVFGRVPVAFSNSFLAVWQIEGIATFEESRMTGEGRIPSGDFRVIVDVAAAHGRFEPIDRAGGGLVDWPGGNAPYAYGAYFHQYLADKYGAERLTQLADATSRRVPLFGGRAFKKVFGRSSGDVWKDFRASRARAGVSRSDTDARAQRLTHHAFTVTAARLGEDGTIYYGIANADGFPALMELRPGGAPRRLAWRAYGNRTSVRGDWIVFDQLERVRSVALYSDLYAVRADGRSRTVYRLTKGARAADPDLSPDGRRIVCTVQATGRRALALLDFSPAGTSSPRGLIDDPDADFTGPRWSPDGLTIVAERRRSDGYALVLIDPQTRAVRTLAARADARLVTPSWTPDGGTVLFAANLGDRPFNIYAVDVPAALSDVASAKADDVRQVTDTAGGAQFPELAPNGTLTYVGYTPDGYDLFSVSVGSFRLKAEATGVEVAKAAAGRAAEATRVEAAEATGKNWNAEAPARARENPPLQESRGFRLPPSRQALPRTAVALAEAGEAEEDRPYRPWRTLKPTFWTPIVVSDAGETVIGAATSMFDALGRHAYAVDAGWAGGRARPDWHAAYAYDRWRPTLRATSFDATGA